MAEEIVRSIATAKPSQIYLAARWHLYAYGLPQHGSIADTSHFLGQDNDQPADLTSSQAALRAQLQPTLRALRSIAPLTLIRTVPILSLPYEAGRERDADHFEPTLTEHRSLEAFTDRIIDDAVQRVGQIMVFDPASLLCRERCVATLDGQLLYTDDNHLTAQAAQLFVPELEPKP
jgi:hypothetical protein